MDTLSDIVEFYKKFENVPKEIVVFHEICCISHVNVEIVKILQMVKKLFSTACFL